MSPRYLFLCDKKDLYDDEIIALFAPFVHS
jgi:hypothetical protein